MTASILIVDDDDDLRDLLGDLLQARGFRVRECRNGIEGLQALDVEFPQLVISDVEMPFLDGPGFVYQMFIANLGRENIPVIVISAGSGLPGIAKALGTPYYLEKPFRIELMMALVERALHEATPPKPTVPFGPSPVL